MKRQTNHYTKMKDMKVTGGNTEQVRCTRNNCDWCTRGAKSINMRMQKCNMAQMRMESNK
eukprot:1159648-Pelagomonas_calceolata.AAC.7